MTAHMARQLVPFILFRCGPWIRTTMTKTCHTDVGWPIPLRLHSGTLRIFVVKPHKGFTTSAVQNKLQARPLVFRAQWQLCTFLQWTGPSPTYAHTHTQKWVCVRVYTVHAMKWPVGAAILHLAVPAKCINWKWETVAELTVCLVALRLSHDKHVTRTHY